MTPPPVTGFCIEVVHPPDPATGGTGSAIEYYDSDQSALWAIVLLCGAGAGMMGGLSGAFLTIWKPELVPALPATLAGVVLSGVPAGWLVWSRGRRRTHLFAEPGRLTVRSGRTGPADLPLAPHQRARVEENHWHDSLAMGCGSAGTAACFWAGRLTAPPRAAWRTC